MIQDYLHLSCEQPIYRWYKGLILPSVDYLFMFSELLNVHMEDFLVKYGTGDIRYGSIQFKSRTKTVYGILHETILGGGIGGF
ncbi:MAG: hypothetical protein E7290_02335 [Lachnospiraceae bacterium]|nr:hypothetical protein [Lachnospiraceae bacterium]